MPTTEVVTLKLEVFPSAADISISGETVVNFPLDCNCRSNDFISEQKVVSVFRAFTPKLPWFIDQKSCFL